MSVDPTASLNYHQAGNSADKKSRRDIVSINSPVEKDMSGLLVEVRHTEHRQGPCCSLLVPGAVLRATSASMLMSGSMTLTTSASMLEPAGAWSSAPEVTNA